MVMDIDDTVTIYCEDKQNEMPGKKYIFMFKAPLAQFKTLFEATPGAGQTQRLHIVP